MKIEKKIITKEEKKRNLEDVFNVESVTDEHIISLAQRVAI